MSKVPISPDLIRTLEIQKRKLDVLERNLSGSGGATVRVEEVILAPEWDYDPLEVPPYVEVRAGLVRFTGAAFFNPTLATSPPPIVAAGGLPGFARPPVTRRTFGVWCECPSFFLKGIPLLINPDGSIEIYEAVSRFPAVDFMTVNLSAGAWCPS